jgi:hypothetical protein
MSQTFRKRAAVGFATAISALVVSGAVATPSFAYTHSHGCDSWSPNDRCLDDGPSGYTLFNPWTSLLFTTYGTYNSSITTCAKAVTAAGNVRNPQYCASAMSASGSISASPDSRGYGYWNGTSGTRQVNGVYNT